VVDELDVLEELVVEEDELEQDVDDDVDEDVEVDVEYDSVLELLVVLDELELDDWLVLLELDD
jgi:hypothetical protein